MAALLLRANATVLQCHSRTPQLEAWTRLADLLIVAAGKPHLVGSEHVKPGAVVVDVGIHRSPELGLIGDVRTSEVLSIVSAISPVPGGVGPLTILQLLENTVLAAERSLI
jgi:methylenetetrahydrofolate dehydrogenase (NADP+)/methenyltetrahydrofolate cyclohydrolase